MRYPGEVALLKSLAGRAYNGIMNTSRPMTKSPRAIAQEALRWRGRFCPAYSSKFSRKDFTQHQLFAALALKTFFKTDYRGVVRLLADFAELDEDLGLAAAPHYSTLCYAAKRLLKKGRSSYSSSAPPCAGRRVDRREADGRHRRHRHGEPPHVPLLFQAGRP